MARPFDFTSHRKARALGDYWDARSHRDPAPSTSNDDLTELIDHLRRVWDSDDRHGQTKDPVLNHLLAKHQEMNSMNAAAPLLAPRSNELPLWIPTGSHEQFAPTGRNRTLRLIASLAAILVIFIVGAIGGRPLFNRFDQGHVGAPSIVAPGTPDATDQSDVLLEIPVPDNVVPDSGFAVAGVRSFTMAPNSTAAWAGDVGDNQHGIWANYILEGSMLITSDEPIDIVRGDGKKETVAAGTQFVLTSGDSAIHRRGETLEWVNSTASDVKMIWVYLVSYYPFSFPLSNQWDETRYDVDGNVSIPNSNWVIRLEEYELEPDGQIPGPQSPNLQFGIAGDDTDAYLAGGPEGELTLRAADSSTTVFVYTLLHTGEGAATPQP